MAFSEDFRKSWTSFKLSKFFHCLENTNIATVWKDWEEKDGSIDDHKERHGEVIKEMVVIMIIKTVFHVVMFTPIVYTGNKKFKIKSLNLFTAIKVWERHDLLSATIGVMNIEQVSYDNLTTLFHLVVFLFPLLSILEICLYCLYQFKVNIII